MPARPAINVAELLARLSHDRRVDDRHHLLDMVEQKTIEEDFIRILQLPQINVPFEVFGLALVRLVGPGRLFVQTLDVRRKQTMQAEMIAFLLREGRPLVDDLAIEQFHAPNAVPDLPILSRLHVRLQSWPRAMSDDLDNQTSHNPISQPCQSIHVADYRLTSTRALARALTGDDRLNNLDPAR